MKTLPNIPMLTPFDRPVDVPVHDILFVIPVLEHDHQLQVFDKEGYLYVALRKDFEPQANRADTNQTLHYLGNSTWIDKHFWSPENKNPNGFRAVQTLGGLGEIAKNDVRLVTHIGSVFTIFTKDGAFFKPAICSIRALCPMHAFDYKNHYAWRKGMNPESIKAKAYANSLQVKSR